MGIYAKYLYPENGYESSKTQAINAGLEVGERYAVSNVMMGQSNTSIFLEGIAGVFNSVQFEFEEEDGTPVDIYRDRRFNTYI